MKGFRVWIETSQPCGDCYRYAFRLYKQLAEQGKDVALVHATVTHPESGKAIQHAWVVYGGDVYDWQSGGRRSSRKEFKSLWKPGPGQTYLTDDLTEVMVLAARSGHYGPW